MDKAREEAGKRGIPGWVDDTTGRLQLPDESFGEFLEGKAERNGDKVFLSYQDQTVSYQQLLERVSRVANALLDLGVKPGEKLAVMMYNRPEFLYSTFAAETIGAVHLPVNVALRGNWLAYIINQSDTETLVVEQHFMDAIEAVRSELKHLRRIIVLPSVEGKGPLPPGYISFEDLYQASSKTTHFYLKSGDMVRIHYTSGTTGLPKGIVTRLPMPQYWERDEAQLKYCQKPEDILYAMLPLYHSMGYAQSTITLNLEGSMRMAPRFSASRFWPEAREYGCTTFRFAGSILNILLKQPPDPQDKNHRVRFADGYAPVADIREEFYNRFGVSLVERYQTSDMGGGGPRNIPGDKKGSIGRDLGVGKIIKILDENCNKCPPNVVGEIVVKPRQPGVVAKVEYYKMPEASAEKVRGGWFHTGDYGYQDEEGWIFFSDREREFIRRRGENISSLEIERVVNSHPDVLESAVVGVPSEFKGDQDIKTCVVLKTGRKLKPEELIAYCEERMGYYMVPSYVDFRDSLPKTGNQRIQKYILVDEGITDKMWDRDKAGYKLKSRMNIAAPPGRQENISSGRDSPG